MNDFGQRKEDILGKLDKSFIGKWDEKIKELCDKINKKENYYTTSSCAGRVVIVIDKDKKAPGVFLFVSHEFVGFEELKRRLGEIACVFCSSEKLTRSQSSLEMAVVNKRNLDNNVKKFQATLERAKLIKYKQESCILHVACGSLKDAEELLKKAQLAGWKRSGIISSGKRFVVEMMGTDKLEFPIISGGRILVSDNFLKLVIKKSNDNLKKSWMKIEGLKKEL